VLDPSLIPQGSSHDILIAAGAAFFGVILLAGAPRGYLPGLVNLRQAGPAQSPAGVNITIHQYHYRRWHQPGDTGRRLLPRCNFQGRAVIMFVAAVALFHGLRRLFGRRPRSADPDCGRSLGDRPAMALKRLAITPANR